MSLKEVILLETALFNFSLHCYPGRIDHISRCLCVYAASLWWEDTPSVIASAWWETDAINRHYPMWTIAVTCRPLNEASIEDHEKLLSVPLNSLVIKVLNPLTHNAETMISVIDGAGNAVHQITNLLGTLGVELRTGESFDETEYPAAGEWGNATGVTPFSAAFCK